MVILTDGFWAHLFFRLTDINTHCLAEFRKHWECLDNRNQQLWQCRPAEWKLNKCVYDNLVRLASAQPLKHRCFCHHY